MIDHLTLPVADVATSKAFYSAALAPLGYQMLFERISETTGKPELVGFKDTTGNLIILKQQGPTPSPIHVAFAAADRSLVEAFYTSAMSAGGRDNGAPALCPDYHPGYYGGFVFDPDGHNIEAVCHVVSTHLESKTEIGMIALGDGISVRRMVVHAQAPKGTVILLHGFPETLYAWLGVARALAEDYDIHTFDWPGYGLSSRPSPDEFSYAPSDYANLLCQYIAAAGIDRTSLTIYATDISGLPTLLLALREPDIARRIIVGDFAPFNRPDFMHPDLRNLKVKPLSEQIRDKWNAGWKDLVEARGFGAGLPPEAQYEVAREFKDDMAQCWSHSGMTTMDAFYHYYSYFTRDEDYFEQRLSDMKTSVKVVWGELDPYINKAMGEELAERLGVEFKLLPGIGHYPHNQAPDLVVAEIRESFL
jgi:pimeloyl-ACP methyl ester carboxylesterase